MRTATAGHGGRTLRSWVELARHHRRRVKGDAASRLWIQQRVRTAFESHAGRSLTPDDRVLEIGCGQRAPALLLFNGAGIRATGVDLDVVPARLGLRPIWRMWRSNGPERVAKTVARRTLFDRAFYRELERINGSPLPRHGLDIRAMDACDLDLPDESYDFVYSLASFEHIDDVPAACAEVGRVLRPGGCAYLAIHLFPSLSGGHHLTWGRPDRKASPHVPPWDHLRDNQDPSHIYLNGLRKADYLEYIEKYLVVRDVATWFEGETYLTPELEAELSDFTREDLLTRSIHVVAVKP